MSDDPSHTPEPQFAANAARRQLGGRLWRLVLKELREILRDRRTIITLVVMPILIYPLLAVVFQRFLLTAIAVEQGVEYMIGVDSEPAKRMLDRQLRVGEKSLSQWERDSGSEKAEKRFLVPLDAHDLERGVIASTLHLAVLADRSEAEDPEAGLRVPMRWQLLYRVGSPTSEAALHYVESRLQAFNEATLDHELRRLGVVAALPAATTRHPIRFTGAPIFSLAALIPLILVLMTVTGAVYPAIDLTAGERERGTLETLIAAPVPRVGLLMAKYVAVLTVALLTALVNLAGMTITAHSTGLAARLFGGGMSFDVVIKVLLLLGLFAAFFSAILLALTSYARSFKEAQAYIIPLMLLCLVPGVLCLMPGLQFTRWMAVTPLVNIVMLARDLLEGSVMPGLAIAAVCSTILYVAAAIALAARIFGTDAILYGSQATWSDLVRRPPTRLAAVGLPAALLTVALMFSFYFVLGTGLGRSEVMTMGRRLLVNALITALVFGGIPIALAMFSRVRSSSGLGLSRPGAMGLIAAALLGVSLWPFAYEMYFFSERFGMPTLGRDQMQHFEQMLAELQRQPLPLVLLTMAVVPGIFEELTFRGFLFGSLRNVLSGSVSVAVSAVVFGVFHEVLLPGRFLASALIGVVLGWVRLRTGSVVPCMLLHVIHNGFLLALVHSKDELVAWGWGAMEQTHLPATWFAVAGVGIVLGGGLIVVSNIRRK